MSPTIKQYDAVGGIAISHRYQSDKGEISRIDPSFISNEMHEIYCIEGNLFDDIERYETKEEAEKRIEELLG